MSPKTIDGLEDITPDPSNPNQGTKRGRYMVEESLRKVGAARSIVVDANGIILAGNKTAEGVADVFGTDAKVRVVQTQGEELVIVQRTDLDLEHDPENVARELTILDNRAGELGLDWDVESLLNAKEEGVQLDDFFYEEELLELINQEPEFQRVEFVARLDQKQQVTCPNCQHEFQA